MGERDEAGSGLVIHLNRGDHLELPAPDLDSGTLNTLARQISCCGLVNAVDAIDQAYPLKPLRYRNGSTEEGA